MNARIVLSMGTTTSPPSNYSTVATPSDVTDDREDGHWCPGFGLGIQWTDTRFVVTSLALLVLNIIVVVGNSFVILAVFMLPKLRTNVSVFIVSLAISDLALGLTVLPFSSSLEMLGYWPFGSLWCSAWLAVDVWLSTASILNLCAISLDRYLAISRPFKYPMLMSSSRSKLLVSGVWVTAFLICLPPLIGWGRSSDIPLAEYHQSDFDVTNGYINVTTTMVAAASTKIHRRPIIRRSLATTSSANYTTAVLSTLAACTTTLADYPTCQLTSEQGYVIYSALGSFWLPAAVMMMFYWRIYRAAVRTTGAIKRGVLTSSKRDARRGSGESTVTLRVHRGGGGRPAASTASSAGGRGSRGDIMTGTGMQHRGSNTPGLLRLDLPDGLTCPGSNISSNLSSKRSSRDSNFSFDFEIHPPVRNGGVGGGADVNGLNTTFGSSDESGAVKTMAGTAAATVSGVVPKIRITFTQRNDILATAEDENATPPFRRRRKPRLSEIRQQSSHELSVGSEREHRRHGIQYDESIRESGNLARMGRMQWRAHAKRLKREKKAAKTVGIIVGGFMLCWSPFFTAYLLKAFCADCTPPLLFTVFFWLGYCNSAVNPFVYALFSRDYRYAFKKLLTCRCRREHPVPIRRKSSRFMSLINSIKLRISSRGTDSSL